MTEPERDTPPEGLGDLPRYDDEANPLWRDRALLVLVAAMVFFPMLGAFGLWDPWETHYGEVGRQILERQDWISTWWGSHWQDAGGAQEGKPFYSKPVLLMWMMAMGLQLFGFSEWGIRIGVCLVAILTLLLVYSMGARVWSRRAGWLMAGVLGTSPFFFFLSRQAQTDMPFVGMMTIGMCFFMMGIFGRDRDRPPDLFSYALTLGWIGVVTIPQIGLVLMGLSRWRGGDSAVMRALTDPPWLGIGLGAGLLAIGLGGAIASLVVARREGPEARRLRNRLAVGALVVPWALLLALLVVVLVGSPDRLRNLQGWFVWGPTQAALYSTCLVFAAYMTLARPSLTRRQLYLLTFYLFIGLATLAKGLLGFLLPGAVLFFYILLTREWRMMREVELLRGVPIFIAASFPWYAAMLIRHTHGFWQRFFIHDHFKRLAQGVHALDEGSFEHFARWLGYGLFPWVALVPAGLARLFVHGRDETDDPRNRATLMLLLWAAIAFTLFSLSSTKFHHYIFPAVPPVAMLVGLALDDLFAERRAVSWPLYLFGFAILGLVAWDIIADPQVLKNLFTYKYDREWDNATWDRSFRWALVGICTPAAIGVILLLMRRKVLRRVGVAAIFVTGLALSYFCLDVYMPRVSQTWSQKGLWDHYYGTCERIDPNAPDAYERYCTAPQNARVCAQGYDRRRRLDPRKRYCAEPVIAYKLNWRGETYYSQNEVIPIRDNDDFTHFLGQVGEGPFYGIMEMARYRSDFKRRLPPRLRGKSCIVYNRNLKFVLIKAPAEPDDPECVDLGTRGAKKK